jgi:hypothetical protein
MDDINNILIHMIESSLKTKGSTTTSELTECCNLLLHDYIGTFPVDKIPKKMKNMQSCIINLDDSTQPGSHWIALYRTGSRGTIVYDSFGRKASKILFKKAKELKKYINTESDAEQKKIEENCGQRCIAWLLLCEIYGENAALTI